VRVFNLLVIPALGFFFFFFSLCVPFQLCVTTEIKRKKTGAEFKKIKLQRTGQQLIFQTESVRVRNSYALEKALERERETTKPSKQLPRRYNKSKKKKIGGRKGKRFFRVVILCGT
jgi:hypothetical protein